MAKRVTLLMVINKINMNIPKIRPSISRKARRIATASTLLLIVGVFSFSSLITPTQQVSADNIDAQINALQQENQQNQDTVANLQNQAVSYQDAINTLRAQILSLQGQVDNNVAKQADLQRQIDANQIELVRQKSVLGENLKVSYVDGKPSTIEMLASSKNLSEFVDKEEYRTSVQNKIQSTLKKITTIQNELNSQKQQVEALLVEQKKQQVQLASAKAEQDTMLAYNQSQQENFNAKTRANESKIADLIAQQRRANSTLPPSGYYFLRFSGAAQSFNPGSYPYKNAGFGMSPGPGCVDNDGPDKWGYCTRQCVSYTAWAVEASGRKAPMYYGNAKDWVWAAQRDGVYVTTTPMPGDVAISTAGTWGHAMYVEAVSGNKIYVSQYNAGLAGEYSTQWREYR